MQQGDRGEKVKGLYAVFWFFFKGGLLWSLTWWVSRLVCSLLVCGPEVLYCLLRLGGGSVRSVLTLTVRLWQFYFWFVRMPFFSVPCCLLRMAHSGFGWV
jgi:hypothetical protein